MKLKKCPFCGGKATFTNISQTTLFYVLCEKCKVFTDIYVEKMNAVKFWNSRVTDKKDSKLTKKDS